jgi:outer membrane receptor protein involved in Fe transport
VTLARYQFVTNGSADLGTIDNQLEGRFNTGPVSHKVLVGVDYKKYRLDEYQATDFGAGGNPVTASLSIFNPVYGSAAAVGAPYLTATKRNRPSPPASTASGARRCSAWATAGNHLIPVITPATIKTSVNSNT